MSSLPWVGWGLGKVIPVTEERLGRNGTFYPSLVWGENSAWGSVFDTGLFADYEKLVFAIELLSGKHHHPSLTGIWGLAVCPVRWFLLKGWGSRAWSKPFLQLQERTFSEGAWLGRVLAWPAASQALCAPWEGSHGGLSSFGANLCQLLGGELVLGAFCFNSAVQCQGSIWALVLEMFWLWLC